jgi:hypothetical protein
MKRWVIEKNDLVHISPIFRGRHREWLKKLAMRLFNVDAVNRLYERSCHLRGADFADHILDDLGVEYLIGYIDRLETLPEGPFITVSNHPYGGLDGIMLIDLLAHRRSDYKLMANQFLSSVEALQDHFISVKPKVGNKVPDSATVVKSIRETLAHLEAGHPVGFFPAGAVSLFFVSKFHVRDREWQEGILKLIQRAKVPVLPIRFYDRNSNFFYFLGMINWRIRTVRMPYELFNKYERPHRIGIGELITPEQIASYGAVNRLGDCLREAVYGMKEPASWCPRKSYKSRSNG